MKKVIQSFLIIIFLLINTSIFSSFAESNISQIILSQTNDRLPEIKIYFDVLDNSGFHINNIRKEQVKVNIGEKNTDITSLNQFESTGEGVAYTILVDISKSLSNQQFEEIKKSINQWDDNLKPKDLLSIITFGDDVKILNDFSGNKTLIREKIKSLKMTDHNTQFHKGIHEAIIKTEQRSEQGFPDRRVIIVFSDGIEDFQGGLNKQEVLDKIKTSNIPIYSIGFFRNYSSSIEKLKQEEGLKNIGEFSRTSGGIYLDPRTNNQMITEKYNIIHKKILQLYTLKVKCVSCQGNIESTIQMTLTEDNKSLTDRKTITLKAPEVNSSPVPVASSPPVTKKETNMDNYLIFIGILLLVIIVFIIFLTLKKKKAAKISKQLEEDIPEKIQGSRDIQKIVKNEDIEIDQNIDSSLGVNVNLSVVGSRKNSTSFKRKLNNFLIIGRNPSCDIVLDNDEKISGKHCRIVYQNNKIFLEDLGSKNGTFHNGAKITHKEVIEDQDEILVGNTKLHFFIEN